LNHESNKRFKPAIMMNFNQFTVKTQEVLQKAVQRAQSDGHQAIEPEHVLYAMTQDSDGPLAAIGKGKWGCLCTP
jgi:ATPases with chaperone activity, ATP-binding subunit